MKFSGYVVFAYGLIVMMGGVVGYLMAGSLSSLAMGTICGAFMIAAGLGMTRWSTVAYFISLTLTFILTLFFVYRYYLTQKFFPAGVMALLSAVVLILLLTVKEKKIQG